MLCNQLRASIVASAADATAAALVMTYTVTPCHASFNHKASHGMCCDSFACAATLLLQVMADLVADKLGADAGTVLVLCKQF